MPDTDAGYRFRILILDTDPDTDHNAWLLVLTDWYKNRN